MSDQIAACVYTRISITAMITEQLTGANFHLAMVATARGERLLIGRRPVRN